MILIYNDLPYVFPQTCHMIYQSSFSLDENAFFITNTEPPKLVVDKLLTEILMNLI